ncbi:MAG: sulfotransferase [Planctomycetota bacterium]
MTPNHPPPSEDGLIPPIILLGNVRSGTSMVQSFFDHVEGTRAWFEPRTVWAYAAPGRRHDRFTAKDATPKVIRYIRGRFIKKQQEMGGRIMEKTPSNILRVPYVRAIFPECKLIYILREPLANLSSAEFRWQKTINKGQLRSRLAETPSFQIPYYATRFAVDQFRKRVLKSKHVSIWGVRYPGVYGDRAEMPVEHVIAKQWAYGAKAAREDIAQIERQHPGTVLSVRYEDLVRDPEPVFRKMCAHVGAELTDDVAATVASKADPSRQDKWKRLDPELIRAVLPYVAQEMVENGYEPPTEMPTEEERRAILSSEHLSSGGGGASARLGRSDG